MPSNHTPNYQLNQWEADDRVLRTDFNADNAKIDAALKAEADARAAVEAKADALAGSKADVSALAVKAEVVTGVYKGDGKESRFIELGFTPKAVLVVRDNGAFQSGGGSNYYGGLALPDHPVSYDSFLILSIAEGGFMVYKNSNSKGSYVSNNDGFTYHYIALK